jgi:hypothetical protein
VYSTRVSLIPRPTFPIRCHSTNLGGSFTCVRAQASDPLAADRTTTATVQPVRKRTPATGGMIARTYGRRNHSDAGHPRYCRASSDSSFAAASRSPARSSGRAESASCALSSETAFPSLTYRARHREREAPAALGADELRGHAPIRRQPPVARVGRRSDAMIPRAVAVRRERRAWFFASSATKSVWEAPPNLTVPR